MSPPGSNVCRGCGTGIRWIRLNGRWHPAELADKQIIVDGKLVRGPESHFAHCVHAERFRKD